MSTRSRHGWADRAIFAWLAGSTAVLCMAICGCRGSVSPQREPVAIFGVDDQVSGSMRGVHFDLRRAQRMLQDAIAGSQKLELVGERDSQAFRIELTITLATERESTSFEEKGIYRAVQLDLVLTRWRDQSEHDKIAAMGKAFLVQDPDRVERQEGFALVLQQAIKNAIEHVDLQLSGRSMSPEGLRKLLTSDRTEDRLYVLRCMRERKERDLVPEVIRMLSDPDPEVAMEAVGVLVALKDQRAAEPLIRMAQGRDPLFLLQVITALSEIQGPVARGFLFTVAAGHSSPEIRERAREAYDNLIEREQAGVGAAEPVEHNTVAGRALDRPGGSAGAVDGSKSNSSKGSGAP